MKDIFIIDTTLREGNQCPGVRFNINQSVEIANALSEIKVDCIEIGHPFASEAEFDRVKAVVDNFPNMPVLSHARAKKEDIDAVKRTGSAWVGIFAGINDSARETRLNGRTIEQVLNLVSAGIKHAKSLGLKVRYTVEDASRTDMSDLIQAYKIAIESGADRICYSDSVGCDNPGTIFKKIKSLKEQFPNIDVEVHCHDDRGLAMANSLAAISAGANWISSTVNGIGERCGITDTLSLIANLYYEYGRILPKPGILKKVAKLVSGVTRQLISMQKPVVGENAFKHTAKLHKDAVKKDIEAYAWVNPEIFGEKNIIDCIGMPEQYSDFLVNPQVISATELKYHRHGPGSRYVMLDDRFVKDCRCYCIVREVIHVEKQEYSHVDSHRHHVDSLFLFIGNDNMMNGLEVEVLLGNEILQVHSPASVFIPAGVEHSYRFISGSGKFINFVLAGNYNQSLLENDFLIQARRNHVTV